MAFHSLLRVCCKNSLIFHVPIAHLEWHSLEHRDPTKALWRILKSMSHVLHHGLLPDRFLYSLLRLNVVGICVEGFNLPLRFILPLLSLT